MPVTPLVMLTACIIVTDTGADATPSSVTPLSAQKTRILFEVTRFLTHPVIPASFPAISSSFPMLLGGLTRLSAYSFAFDIASSSAKETALIISVNFSYSLLFIRLFYIIISIMKTMEKHDKYPAHGGDCKQNNIKLDFSVNINPLGPPKSVLNALKNPDALLGKYPSPDQSALREQLEAKRNIPMNRILIGNGASEIISILAGAIATRKLKNSSTENGGNILPVASVIAPTFSGYERALSAYGFDIKYFDLPEHDFRFNESFFDHGIKDIDNLDLVILCNPNNPTGQAIPRALIKKIADECKRRDIILAIDETFMGLVKDKSKYSCESILGKNKNLILIDAFTKLYAIPGVRLGYCATYNEELLKDMSSIKPEWSVSTFAEAAGIAALSENSYIDEAIALIEKEKKYLLKELSSLGFCPQEGEAPFILFSIPKKYNAKTFYDKMIKDHGILLRNCSNFHGLDDHYFRIGIKKHEENVELMKALKNVSSYCSQGTRLQQ